MGNIRIFSTGHDNGAVRDRWLFITVFLGNPLRKRKTYAEHQREGSHKIEQEKMIRRSPKRDGMTDEETEVFFRTASEGNEVDWF